jgi:hypothetical protein
VAGATGNGNDVCDVVSSGPFTVNANDSITVAFALIAGDDLADLQNSAVDAQTMWDGIPLGTVEAPVMDNSILNAFPNPSNRNTVVTYNLAESGFVKVNLLDATGKLVREVSAGEKSVGAYNVEIETAELPEGMYLVQMITSKGVVTRKLIVSH